MNALPRSKSSPTHQPRFWSKAEAPKKIDSISVTLSTAQSLMSWLNDEAPSNIPNIVVTPEVSHAPMSPLKDDAAELQSLHQQFEQ